MVFTAACINLVGGYECNCTGPWFGDRCELDGDQCASDPCRNGATCVDRILSFVCQCVHGYEGKLFLRSGMVLVKKKLKK